MFRDISFWRRTTTRVVFWVAPLTFTSVLPHTIPTPAIQSVPLPLVEKSKKATGALSRETALIGSEIGIRSTPSPNDVSWSMVAYRGGRGFESIQYHSIRYHPPSSASTYSIPPDRFYSFTNRRASCPSESATPRG